MIRAMVLLRGVAAVVLICAASAPTLARNADLPSATTPDGRLYGHIAYAEADPAVLVDAPKGFAVGQECKVQPAMIPDLTRLIAAAHEAHLGADLRGVSCFRTVEHQERLFCEKHGRSGECVDPDKRAISVAPPGHSEHATGYAIDFATRPEGGCADVENCFADTPVGRWLLLNAADYGFELSFPKDNPQGVTWEPWHWRWVGTSNSEAGALTARTLFAEARQRFPANPRIPTMVIRVVAEPPLPGAGPDVAQVAPAGAAPAPQEAPAPAG